MTDDLDPDGLYHLATPTELVRYRRDGKIEPPSLETEGFVHCSWGHQVAGTVAKHFADEPVVVACELDVDAVWPDLVEEDSYGSGQAFPHLYAAVPVAAVRSEHPVGPLPGGGAADGSA